MTLEQLRRVMRRLGRRMWVRATLYCAVAVLTALIGALVKTWIPESLAGRIGADSVGNLLGILATSMLAVTTFSLSTMVSAYSSASNGATPRATRLLIADSAAQGALSTFIGAFLFSVVGLIALSTGIYGDSGRVVLFAATVGVIVLITLTLLAWIEQLSSFGRVGATINLVERATRDALEMHLDDPYLGAAPGAASPEAGYAVESDEIGYVEHIDVARLSELAEDACLVLHVALRPGVFAVPGRPLLHCEGGPPDAKTAESLRAAFTISDERNFDQDPRYGFVVLTEIGTRALSHAVNDSGTAIDVIGTATRLLCEWASVPAATPEARYGRVFVPPLAIEDAFEDVFPLLARDGAGRLEVGIRLQKGLAAIAATGDPRFASAAAQQAALALARAEETLTFAPDLEALRRCAAAAFRP